MRHRAAPLLRERDEYLTHLLEKGLEPTRVRCVAAFLVHIVQLLALDRLREVEQHEIEDPRSQSAFQPFLLSRRFYAEPHDWLQRLDCLTCFAERRWSHWRDRLPRVPL